MTKRRRKNSGNFYLKNENLLREINECKKTYCEFDDKKYSDFDIILQNEDKITPELIEEGKIARAARLNDILGSHKFHNEGFTNKQVDQYLEEYGWKPESFEASDIVFRKMTDEHVPTKIDKHGNEVKIKPKFPPFKHVVVDNGEEKVVGWSHMKNGKWSQTHGRLNNGLGQSFLSLVEQYAKKPNWSGYSWKEEMKFKAVERLTEVALQFDESKSSNPFSYYTMTVERTFIHVLQKEKKQLEIKKAMLEHHPELGLYQTYNEQAEVEIENYERDNNIKSNKNVYTSGKSLSQLKAEQEKAKKR